MVVIIPLDAAAILGVLNPDSLPYRGVRGQLDSIQLLLLLCLEHIERSSTP
jgi:hypothetical protein